MKHSFASMSVKQKLFVAVFVHKCLMMLNDVEYTTFKMFVTQISNYLFVISFQLMFYKTLRYRLARVFTSVLSVKNCKGETGKDIVLSLIVRSVSSYKTQMDY